MVYIKIYLTYVIQRDVHQCKNKSKNQRTRLNLQKTTIRSIFLLQYQFRCYSQINSPFPA